MQHGKLHFNARGMLAAMRLFEGRCKAGAGRCIKQRGKRKLRCSPYVVRRIRKQRRSAGPRSAMCMHKCRWRIPFGVFAHIIFSSTTGCSLYYVCTTHVEQLLNYSECNEHAYGACITPCARASVQACRAPLLCGAR